MVAVGANDFRPDVQGMRALAIVLVLLTHAGVPIVRGGFVGVDVFLVISGYVISRMLVAELRATGRISVVGSTGAGSGGWLRRPGWPSPPDW